MLTVALAVTTSALFGVADFFGGVASRKDSAVAVTANAHSIGLVLFTLALLVFPAPFVARDVIAGAAAGVAGGVGVVSLYAALARGRMSIVAPVTAALSGSLPALFDLARGSSLAPTSLAGLALALLATIIVSASSAEDGSGARALSPVALGLSLLAGVGFAGSFIAFSYSGDAAGFWPLAAARLVSVGMLGSLALVRRGHVGVSAEARPMTIGAGLLDAAANVTMIAAIRIGPLAVASVLGSLYPVVTLLLARFVLGEHLRWVQRLGIALAIVAVVLSSLP